MLPPVVVRCEHYADFFTQLIDEDDDGVGLSDRAGKAFAVPETSAAPVSRRVIAHIASIFRLWNERCYGGRHDDVIAPLRTSASVLSSA